MIGAHLNIEMRGIERGKEIGEIGRGKGIGNMMIGGIGGRGEGVGIKIDMVRIKWKREGKPQQLQLHQQATLTTATSSYPTRSPCQSRSPCHQSPVSVANVSVPVHPWDITVATRATTRVNSGTLSHGYHASTTHQTSPPPPWSTQRRCAA